jgi:hypothetical protein
LKEDDWTLPIQTLEFLYATSFCKKQLSTIYMFNDVIYFFVRREIFVHTLFEPQAKKTPSLLLTLHKERNKSPFFAKATLKVSPWMLHKNTIVEGTNPV